MDVQQRSSLISNRTIPVFHGESLLVLFDFEVLLLERSINLTELRWLFYLVWIFFFHGETSVFSCGEFIPVRVIGEFSVLVLDLEWISLLIPNEFVQVCENIKENRGHPSLIFEVGYSEEDVILRFENISPIHDEIRFPADIGLKTVHLANNVFELDEVLP